MTRSASLMGPLATTAALLALGVSSPRLAAPLRNDRPNRADTERMERGYYERILAGGSGPEGPAPAVAAPRPFDAGRLCDAVDDLREYVLRPNVTTEHRGASWSTNSRGMRDREYADRAPEATARVALVGDSIGAGWGVNDGLGFEPLAEQIWNAEAGANRRAVEVLNHSVPGHAPGQRWEHFRRTGWPLAPDLVLFEATPADLGWDERRLRVLLPQGLGWDAPQYHHALAESGARRGGDAEAYKAALRPMRLAILSNVYREAVAECRSRGAVPAWVLIPRVGRPIDPDERSALMQTAREAGFAILLDLSGSFDGREPADLAIAPDDFHPNAEGHALLARRLASALEERPEWRAIREGRR